MKRQSSGTATKPPGGDSIVDTYATIDPVTGKVTFTFSGIVHATGGDFTGVVHAQGLDLAEVIQGFFASSAQKVRWMSNNGTIDQSGFFGKSGLGAHELHAYAGTTGNEKDRIIIDDVGRSSFLQLNTFGFRRIAFGTATLVFAGAAKTGLTAFAHGLGAVPAVVIATADFSGAATALIDIDSASLSTTQFSARASDVDGIARTGNQPFWWLAIA